MNYYTPTEAAQYARCHVETIRKALREHTLRGARRNGARAWKIRQDWLDDWIGDEDRAA